MSLRHLRTTLGTGMHTSTTHSSQPSQTTTTTTTNPYKGMVRERDAQIEALQTQLAALNTKLEVYEKQTYNRHDATGTENNGVRRRHKRMIHATTVHESICNSSTGSGTSKNYRRQITQKRHRMGRNASIATRNTLKDIHNMNMNPTNDTDNGAAGSNTSCTKSTDDRRDTNNNNHSSQHTNLLAQRMLDMFQNPLSHMDYLKSEEFSKDFLKLCHKMRSVLEKEPRVIFVQSPAYVFGDIHGNLEDLHFFSDNIWRLGMSLTAGNFVFLGDYVDRGKSCLEVVAYLFALKLMLPHKVTLLRGNHETRDVNGWEEHYGERSFLYQCRDRFGDELGYRIWEQTNQVFDRMPLAGVIDQDIFCVHGGIPRPLVVDDHNNSKRHRRMPRASTTRIQDVLNVPRVAGINPPYEHEDDAYQQVASDCIWSDPASDNQEATSVDQHTGYGESLRGGGAICFGHKAVTDFLKEQDMSYIMRAHEAHAEGVAVSKAARVFTVFSTSQDHNQGSDAMAGCMLVDAEKLQVINRSSAYQNQYVHRRDSVSLASVSEAEIQQRIKIGLVTHVEESSRNNTCGHGDDDEEEDDDENVEWEDFTAGDSSDQNVAGEDDSEDEDDSTEDQGYIFDSERKLSVDITCTNNTHDDDIGSMDPTTTTSMAAEVAWTSTKGNSNNSLITARRGSRDREGGHGTHQRFPAINENDDDEDDDEVDTVDGEDDESMDE